MRKASEIAKDMHVTVSSRTPFGPLETWQPDFAAAVTAARLEVVARLREMADRLWVTDVNPYQVKALHDAADQLELEVKHAAE